MKKVISINIGGSIFQVEEDAFDKLNAYLNELKKHFSTNPEGNEIITDIENRIAELLRSKINAFKAAITIEDVNEVTSSMGAPKDFAGGEETTGETTSQKTESKTNSTSSEYQQSRIYRDPDSRIIGGVCSGLGHYFKIDPLWIRLFFVIFSITILKVVFFGFSPVLVYIILWIIIPEAKTTAEKLQMRKEQINIDNIQKSVQTEFNKVKDTMQSKDFQGKAESFARRLADFIKVLILGILNIIRIFAKVFFVVMGFIAIVVAISALSGSIIYSNWGYFHLLKGLHFFENNNDKILAQSAVFLLAMASGLLCFTFAHALSKRKLANKPRLAFRTSTILICVASLVIWIFLTVKVTSYFAASQKIENVISLDSSRHHFYIRNISGTHHSYSYESMDLNYFTDDSLKIDDVKIIIEASDEKSGTVKETKISRGQNSELARINASGILALSSVNDSVIAVPSTFSLLNNQVYRKQELVYLIKIPVGDKFTIDEGMYDNIDIMTTRDVYAHPGSTYTVTKDGIQCDDCTKIYNSENINTSSYPLNIPLNGHEFRKVDVSSTINLKVVRGNYFEIKAGGIDKLNDLNIDFSSNGVNISDNRRWSFGLNHKKSIDIIIVMPQLDELKISGSVDAFVDGFNENELKLRLSGVSSCKTNIDVRRLKINMSGASSIYLNGNITNCDANVEGASKLHAGETSIQNIFIDLSGASFAEVNCSEKLEAEASGASKLKYKGDVKNIISNNSGASSIERID